MTPIKKDGNSKPKLRRKPIYTDFESLPLMLNVNETAAVLRISRAGAYNLINSGHIPKTAIGNRVLVSKADLMQLIQPNKQ